MAPYFKTKLKYKLISTTFRAEKFKNPHYRAKKSEYYGNITRRIKLFKTYKKTAKIRTKYKQTTEILDFKAKMWYNNLVKQRNDTRVVPYDVTE